MGQDGKDIPVRLVLGADDASARRDVFSPVTSVLIPTIQRRKNRFALFQYCARLQPTDLRFGVSLDINPIMIARMIVWAKNSR